MACNQDCARRGFSTHLSGCAARIADEMRSDHYYNGHRGAASECACMTVDPRPEWVRRARANALVAKDMTRA